MRHCTPCQALEPFQSLNANTHYLVILKKLFECPVHSISLILDALYIYHLVSQLESCLAYHAIFTKIQSLDGTFLF